MKTRTTLWIGCLTMAVMAFTFAANWTVDTQKAKVEFTANGPFGKVNGSFSGLKSKIIFDENNLPGSSIQASVDVNTIQTGVGLRDKDLTGKEEWFNAAKYPQITIQSKQIEKTASGYKITGDLTMKGVTKSVLIGFTFTPAGNGGVFHSLFTLNREDYGVGKNGGSVGKEISITLDVPVTK